MLPAGYDACHNADEVLADFGYDPDADVENPSDSIFCSHGAGYLVRWDEVPAKAHVDSGLARRLDSPAGVNTDAADEDEEVQANNARRRAAAYRGTLEQDKELLAIFERTYGKIKRRGQPAGADNDGKAARTAMHTRPAPVATLPPLPSPSPPGRTTCWWTATT